MKRKASRTAGQMLGMTSLVRLTELCGGSAASAEKLHHVRSCCEKCALGCLPQLFAMSPLVLIWLRLALERTWLRAFFARWCIRLLSDPCA